MKKFLELWRKYLETPVLTILALVSFLLYFSIILGGASFIMSLPLPKLVIVLIGIVTLVIATSIFTIIVMSIAERLTKKEKEKESKEWREWKKSSLKEGSPYRNQLITDLENALTTLKRNNEEGSCSALTKLRDRLRMFFDYHYYNAESKRSKDVEK